MLIAYPNLPLVKNHLGCSSDVWPAVEKALGEIQDYPYPGNRELRSELAKRNYYRIWL